MMNATQILRAYASGDPNAVHRLLPLVYRRLRARAAAYLKHERCGHSLQPTDLVHEVYVRLIDGTRVSWQGKTHFFALAARQMRRILVESARARNAQKRGGRLERVSLDERVGCVPARSMQILALDEALEKLGKLSPRQHEIVELRFFGGLKISEAAYVLGVSERTVKEDWRMARAFLLRELS